MRVWPCSMTAHLLSSPRGSSSTIDLTIATRELACSCRVRTLNDSHDSDHLPIETEMGIAALPMNRLLYKIKLKDSEIKHLQYLLDKSSLEIKESIPENPIEAYTYFIENILNHIHSILETSIIMLPEKEKLFLNATPLHGGTNNVTQLFIREEQL